jgi:hypothetical protein
VTDIVTLQAGNLTANFKFTFNVTHDVIFNIKGLRSHKCICCFIATKPQAAAAAAATAAAAAAVAVPGAGSQIYLFAVT